MAATCCSCSARAIIKYVRDFTNLPYAGFANTHTLTLDLGTWTPQNPLRLFLSGFIEYFSATSMYAAWQAGLTADVALHRSADARRHVEARGR